MTEYNSVIKRNKILLCSIAWMNHKNNALRESQTLKVIYV